MSEGPGNASRIARWEEKKARAAARRAEQQRQDSQQARQTGLQQVPGMAVPHRVDMFTKASGMVEAPRHDDPFARPALAFLATSLSFCACTSCRNPRALPAHSFPVCRS